MSEKEHTPGPWGLDETGQWLQANNGDHPMSGGQYFSICVSATSEADKRLIAAAPDLLCALKDCLSRFVAAFPASADYEPIRRGFEAIAKAEGLDK